MSYKTIFSGSAGPFSGILRLRVAELVTLRFFAKRLFSRGLCFGLYPVGFRVARLVARPFFLSASVSRDSWIGPLFCRLSCRATCGSAFMSLGCCHRRCHHLRCYRRPRRALYRRSRPMDLQSHSYPANRPEIATPLNARRVPEFVPAPHDYLSAINGREAPGPQRWSDRTNQCRVPNASTCRPSDPSL